jgi:hypothetical protein
MGDESAELKALRGENRELQRQKSEVVHGFKQALKLVDVLKRQKVHVSGARCSRRRGLQRSAKYRLMQ